MVNTRPLPGRPFADRPFADRPFAGRPLAGRPFADCRGPRGRSRAEPVGWHVEAAPVGYAQAVAAMEGRAVAVADGRAGEFVWLLEHPALYTAGSSARETDLIAPDRFPVHRTGRGGQYTYHGPGQRVAYVMLDVGGRFGDVRAFVNALEDWLIAALAEFGVSGERRQGRVGIWVARADKGAGVEDKIAAIGIRLKRWVSFHGVALNVAPDLSHYSGIVPCGISGHGVTSLADLGIDAPIAAVDEALKQAFTQVFGAGTIEAPSLLATGQTVGR